MLESVQAEGGEHVPRFNHEIKERVRSTLPLAFARPEDPLLGATLVGVVVKDGEARVDDAVLHGRSDIERGIRFSASPEGLLPDERWSVVFVAMKKGPQGLIYYGASQAPLWIDRPGRRGYRDIARSVNSMSDAIAGRVELAGLSEDDMRAVGAVLRDRGRDVWLRTPVATRGLLGEGLLAAE